MKVYRLTAQLEDYQHIKPVDSRDWSLFQQLRGRPVSDSWSPVAVEVVRETANRPMSDFPHLASHVPVFTDILADALEPVLRGSGELLPLSFPAKSLVAFNVTNVVDVLDETKSSLVRLDEVDGRIVNITKHAFHSNRLPRTGIFKIPQRPVGWVYVTDRFVEAVSSINASGLDCQLLWEFVE